MVGKEGPKKLVAKGASGSRSCEVPENSSGSATRRLSLRAHHHLRRGLVRASLGGLRFGYDRHSLLTEFEPRDRSSIEASLAYTLAVLATHGTKEETAKIDRMADALLPDEKTRAIAAGRALYRDVHGARGIRFWKPPFGKWMPQAYASLESANGSKELWIGVAASYARDLKVRSPGWVIGGMEGPVALAAELASITQNLAPTGHLADPPLIRHLAYVR